MIHYLARSQIGRWTGSWDLGSWARRRQRRARAAYSRPALGFGRNPVLSARPVLHCHAGGGPPQSASAAGLIASLAGSDSTASVSPERLQTGVNPVTPKTV